MIKKFSVSHYKCYFERQTIEPSLPNGKTASGLTVIVGANNAGKTTILEALRIFTQESPHVDSDFRHSDHKIFIEIEDIFGHTRIATNPDLGSTITFSGDPHMLGRQTLRYVPSRRNWKGYTTNQASDMDNYWYNRTVQPDVNSVDTLFVSRIAKLTPTEREAVKSDLKTIMPEMKDWTIDRSRGELYVKYLLKNGASHSSELFGDGLSSIFRIVVAVQDCINNTSSSHSLLIIDEPELSLHPQAQKSLCHYIANASKTLQIIVTTHSPYFVRWSDLNNGSGIYRASESSAGSIISTISLEVRDKINALYNDWQKPNLLDAVAREIFFSNGIVYFEGQEDIGLIRRLCETRNLPELDLFGYGVGGSGNIKYFLQLAKDLNIKACAMYDGDKRSDMEFAKATFPEFMIDILPVDDIRDKMEKDENGKDTKIVKKAGLFDHKGNLKSAHESYIINKIEEISQFLTRK